MDCVVTPLKTLMGFSVHLNVQLKFYNLPNTKTAENNAERLVVPGKSAYTETKIIRKVVTMMCGWAFTGGMPFMWMGGGLGIISLLILLAVGAYFLGTRSRHHD